MSKIIAWTSEKESKAWKQWHHDMWNSIVFGTIKPREPQEDDNVKLAWVIIDGKRTMVGLDRITKKAYQLRNDVPTWIRPLQEISYDSFERWCTTFDV